MTTSQTEKTVYADLLDEDKPISGQKFVCVSFVSPENILKRKEIFFFEEFVKAWDFSKHLEKYRHFFNFVASKYNIDAGTLNADFEEFVQDQKDQLRTSSILDDYKNFTDASEEALENKFSIEHKFQTSTRGMKVRGVYATQEEAEMRCKMLRELDPCHDVYVGPVGMWMPWEPEAYKTGRVEYLEEELNKLMHEKKDNEKNAKIEFDKRIQEAREKAMSENKEIAEKSGNVLTQVMNDEGNLVNVREVDYAAIPDETVVMDVQESANIRRELFEKANPQLKPVSAKEVDTSSNETV